MHLRPMAVLLAALGCLTAPCAAPAAEPDKELLQRIDSAVDDAIAFLKRSQGPDGTWAHVGNTGGVGSEQNIGATALCALALVHCGVDVDDSAIKRAANVVRSRARDLNYTYSVACALLFLDRINTGADAATIQFLAERLLRGQTPNGRWTYYCNRPEGREDNSNTQFAILALWVARVNYKVPADAALRRAEQAFRQNQQQDGGWGYHFDLGPLGATTPSMTCSGLLALAAGNATRTPAQAVLTGGEAGGNVDPAKQEPHDPLARLKRDRQVILARDYLARTVGAPQLHGEHVVYLLWSLERVCMLFNYRTINGVDWYTWGAKLLLQMQRADGGWAGDPISGRNCETAWALLFLRKVNLIPGGESTFTEGKIPRPDRSQRAGKPKVEEDRKGTPGEAKSLKEELRFALGDRVGEILELLEKTQGPEYTQALVDAIPVVRPAAKELVRRALQRRMQRMSSKTLRSYLEVSDAELRLAAIVAAGAKGDKELIPDLIPILNSFTPGQSEAAYAALKKLSGQDHGRNPLSWERWWKERGR